MLLAISLVVSASAARAAPVSKDGADGAAEAAKSQDIVVTASRLDLLGRALTASQGSITSKEIELRPIFRPGQLFESIPGLVVTIHSGEGKANQYLIRGFNLDHGTDFANFVDDMPVNRPTNTHGQGYSDLAFLMPQIVSGIDYTKGPYFAAVGDFGSVASSHARIAKEIPDQAAVTLGTDGYAELFAGGTYRVGSDHRLLAAIQLGHFDGPWHPKEDFNKLNAALRFSKGTDAEGMSLTGLFYKSAGGLITDQPRRAIDAGLIDRFGTLDPSDHSRSLRYSLSAHGAAPVGYAGHVQLSLYAIHSTMTLWNNFTHYLDDPINGDQEAQGERRSTLGGMASFAADVKLGAITNSLTAGVQGRYDAVFVSRRHTQNRKIVLDYCTLEQPDGSVTDYPVVGSYCNADHARLLDISPYIQDVVAWRPWLRTVIGVRADGYYATDRSDVTGAKGGGHQWLAQPKASVTLGPWAKTEFYMSWGRGFHSDDVRGVFGILPAEGIPLAGGRTPLLARTTGAEIGLRTNLLPKLQVQVAMFQQDFRSELTYNADSGQDEAGAPSRRQGIEASAQYCPLRWLEVNSDIALSKARYHTSDLSPYDLTGRYIADAPSFIGSIGVLVDRLGPWSAGLQWRKLGPHPLADGTKLPRSSGYSEINADISYRLARRWTLSASIFNLLNSHDDAADYYYATRLPGEPTGGLEDYQRHPLESRSTRLTIATSF